MIAISTAFKRALIGICIDDESVFKELEASCKHSENILLSIDEVLSKLGKGLKDNDCYSVVVGPGSFTGIRIAIALVKGFLASSSKKLIKITTNELMAYSYINSCKPSSNFLTVIDGLSGNYFVCEFDKFGNKIGEERLDVGEIKSDFPIVGLSEENVPFVTYKVEPTAKDLLNLSFEKKKLNDFIDENELIPLYLRKSQAEVSLEEGKIKKS